MRILRIRIGIRLAIAILLLLVLIEGGGNLWATFAVNSASQARLASQQASQQRAQDAARASQAKLGAEVEAKLCSTLRLFEPLATLRPPSGNAVDNPSRAYEQRLSAILAPLAQLGPDIKCKN